ncbi:hypothetical protein C7974DRAFT_407051 [Boeremia exigua]|uniref:uncharacterized protein n=1 Tax=Boeremia exigua TaxID=749465 RepID=UPI001E8DC4ED|nr:uncharacterized protein C7974DRAFT_407051 [Boeremia exigua]KAH6612112.1 hypothetical protein C7974DRAFT_407051 [Boeremia exigua]
MRVRRSVRLFWTAGGVGGWRSAVDQDEHKYKEPCAGGWRSDGGVYECECGILHCTAVHYFRAHVCPRTTELHCTILLLSYTLTR